jgi:hypothetical protein
VTKREENKNEITLIVCHRESSPCHQSNGQARPPNVAKPICYYKSSNQKLIGATLPYLPLHHFFIASIL